MMNGLWLQRELSPFPLPRSKEKISTMSRIRAISGNVITAWPIVASLSTWRLEWGLRGWSLAEPNARASGVIRRNEHHTGSFECGLHSHEGFHHGA
jgi:hypothetical protein